MRTWYTYRVRHSFAPVKGNVSFRFRKDRKSFEVSSTVRDYTFYWRDVAPIIFKQIMIEAELTGKYKL